MASIAMWQENMEDFVKVAKEDESTTEENVSQESEPEVMTASDEAADGVDYEEMFTQLDEEAEKEQKKEALRQYAEHFDREAQSETSSKMLMQKQNVFAIHKQVPDKGEKPDDQVLAELDQDLGLKAPQESPVNKKTSLTLKRTFGYAGSLDKRAPFAKFDIRDDICLEVGGFKHGQVVRDRNGGELIVIGVKRADGMPRLWFQPKDLGRPGAGAFQGASAAANKLRVTLADREEFLSEMKADEFDGAEDSDGEDFLLCRHCRLPVGTQCFIHGDKKDMPLHGECLAQMMRQEVQQGERVRKQKDAETKKKVRKDYDIGWRVGQVPRNMLPAMKLGCQPVPRGMCGLLFNEEGHSVQVAPTLMPAASMNLEYLSVALQVRLREGREPLFSLDPLPDPLQEKKDVMQEKRYDPEWLSGTSVGEVLFQADYHLKELSMGEYEQPVLGMKSCIDLVQDKADREAWHAREWFIVKKASVLMNEDNVLMPYVQMGIEAREQVLGQQGALQDKAVTRPDHPLVKYANEFTHNFDLIAERKSVIYHLRDLAKASVVAKMLIENQVNMYGPWLDLSGELKEVSSLEVPQLWNARLYSQIQVGSTSIVAAEDKERCHGVYGGVNFGLSAVSVSMPSAITQGRVSAINTARSAAGPSAALSAVGVGTKARMASLAAAAPELTLSAMAVPAAPVVSAVGRPAVSVPGVAPPPPVAAAPKTSRAILAPGAVEKPVKPAAGIAAIMQGVSLGLHDEKIQKIKTKVLKLNTKVQNVDYAGLDANKPMREKFVDNVKDAITNEAGHGILTRHVSLVLSAGSVVLDATIAPPANVDFRSLEGRVSGSTTLQGSLLTAVQSVPGIDTVATGPISVDPVDVSTEESTTTTYASTTRMSETQAAATVAATAAAAAPAAPGAAAVARAAPGVPTPLVTMPSVPPAPRAGMSAVMIAPKPPVPTMINPPTYSKPITLPIPGVAEDAKGKINPLSALVRPADEDAAAVRRVVAPPPRQVAAVVRAAPRGVDLNLDQFSIANPTRVEGHGWGEAVDVKCAAMGDLFWSSIESDSCTVFEHDDKELLKAVFNPILSDRREEGELFVPPDTSCEYVQRLRVLVNEEQSTRQQRKEHFLSSDFSMAKPGDLFPKSWVPAAEIANDKASHSSYLHARPDYKKHVHKLAPVLKSTAPIFDESSEDSIQYRIYHLGHLEVRTIEEPTGLEDIGAVYSLKPILQTEKGPAVDEHEKVVKVTEYIEKVHEGHSSYVVIETECGSVVVTEMLMDGSVTWEENPIDTEYRNSIAKVIRSDSNDHRVNVRFLKNFRLKESECDRCQVSQSTCKLYAQKFYSRATGEIGHVYTGLAKQQEDGAWQLPECKYGLYAQGNQTAQATPIVRQEARPTVGDKVQVLETGRIGKVEVDERAEEMPYKVSFNDGKRPKSKWCKECDVQFA